MLSFLLLSALTLTTLFSVFWKFLYDIYVYLLAPQLGQLVDLKKVGGEWALVTGAGAGIGRGYALALAAKGINVCLVGRTRQSLTEVAETLEKKYSVKTKVIVHDFEVVKDSDAEVLRTALEPEFEKIGILVNNVGIMGGEENFIVPFAKNSPNPIDYGRRMVNVNIQSVVLMVGLFLPHFSQHRQGVIVNLSSSCAIRPFFGHAIYASTKAFIDFFSDSIRQEYSDSNIIVQTVYPFFVRTALVPKIAFDRFPSIIAPDPVSFGRSAVGTIGLQERTSGCLQHNFQLHFVNLLDAAFPKSAVDWLQKKLALTISEMNKNYVKKDL